MGPFHRSDPRGSTIPASKASAVACGARGARGTERRPRGSRACAQGLSGDRSAGAHWPARPGSNQQPVWCTARPYTSARTSAKWPRTRSAGQRDAALSAHRPNTRPKGVSHEIQILILSHKDGVHTRSRIELLVLRRDPALRGGSGPVGYFRDSVLRPKWDSPRPSEGNRGLGDVSAEGSEKAFPLPFLFLPLYRGLRPYRAFQPLFRTLLGPYRCICRLWRAPSLGPGTDGPRGRPRSSHPMGCARGELAGLLGHGG
jgi:hypothetical protein